DLSGSYNPQAPPLLILGVTRSPEVCLRRSMLCSIVLVLALSPSAAWSQTAPPLPAWLAGCWQQTRGNSVTLGMWMSPAGGMLLASRTVAGGSVREYEQLVLRQDQAQLVYTAHPSGQAEASFASTEVTDSAFSVANPQHDFPQKISYRRQGKDSLVARIEGPG